MLTQQDYRSAWPSLFDTSDIYAVAVSPSGVAELLLVIDDLADRRSGQPSEAVLPQQPPFTAAPLEGLGLRLPGTGRTFYQVNRVFAPSIPASLVEGQVYNFVMDQRLDAYRRDLGLDPALDTFIPPAEGAEEAPLPTPPESGLLGIQSSSFVDGQYVAGLTFLAVFDGPRPMAPSTDVMIAAIEAAMVNPFTREEFDAALAEINAGSCAQEPVERMAQVNAVWLREDLFHGRANEFIASDVMGCEGLTLEGVNRVRDLALNASTTLVYGIGDVVEDAQTLARPFCIVEVIGELEFVCSQSEFQL